MDTLLFIVYFIYGLSFLTMGLALWLESSRSPALTESRLLRPLALFGIIHGLHEWLEFFLMAVTTQGITEPEWTNALRLVLLAVSFAALLQYGVQSFRASRRSRPWTRRAAVIGIIIYVTLIFASALYSYAGHDEIPWVPLLDALTRYTLAMPGALLASHGLISQTRRSEISPVISRNLRVAALAFAIYGLTQVFVPALEMFPAFWLNGPSFRATFGFPHQAIRSLMALIIMVYLIRATQVVERMRQREMIAAQRARLDALEQVQAELQQREALRHELLRHTVRAQEDERARIARELHDETAQMLSALSLDLATLQRILPDRSQAGPLVERLKDLGREMSQGLYRLVHDLRPAHLDELGLVPALQVLVQEDFSNALDVQMEISGPQRRLDPLVETVLYRLAQEGLTNIVRHAGTRTSRMLIVYDDDWIMMRISDPGAGFDPEERFHPPRGWGLAGMRDRVEALGGDLQIQAAPGEGTTVTATIPLTGGTFKAEEAHNVTDPLDAGG